MTRPRIKSQHPILARVIRNGVFVLTMLALTSALAAPARLHLASDPPGASITVDGKARGVTPLSLTTLSAGKHLVLVEKRSYDTIRKSITLRNDELTSREFKLQPTLGLILVHSTPAGAEVEIDGAHRGVTPSLISDLPLGTYRARLVKPGYIPKEIELKTEGRSPVKYQVKLTSDSASLTIDSAPPNASVTINGVSRGTTPCTVARIPSGDSSLTLELEGFEPYSEALKLSAGESQTVTAVLKSIPSNLTIVSIPAGARIYVDNQFRGKSPVKLERLQPNTYRIRAELPSHDMLIRNVAVSRAQDVIEEFRLKRNAGDLRITTEPAGVDVLLDGKRVGTTAAGTNKTDTISEPLAVKLIPAGAHVITLTKVGFYTAKQKLDIVRDESQTHHVKLKRRFIRNYEVKTASEVYRGVIVEIDAQRNIKLETHPGIFKTIPYQEILSGKPLRTGALKEDL